MPPVEGDNEAGFWESMAIYSLNDALLHSAGTTWDDWEPFPEAWLGSSEAQAFQARAADAVGAAFGEEALIVLKDPRICRIVGFWARVVERLRMTPLYLIPLRNPLEVSASLHRRDKFSPAKSHLLWLRHVLDAELASRGSPRTIVTFDRLLSNWRATADRIRDQLSLDDLWHTSVHRDPEIERFLQPSMRHNQASHQELEQAPDVPSWVKDAFRAMLQLADDPDSSPAMEALDGIRLAFDDATRSFKEALPDEHTAARRIAALEATAQSAQKHALALESIVKECRSTELKLAYLRQGAAQSEQQRNRLSDHLNRIQSSHTWQVARHLLTLERRFPQTARTFVAASKVIWWTVTARLPNRLRLRSAIRDIQSSGLFDEDWYIRTYPDVLTLGLPPLMHWCLVGWRKRHCPSPLFDTAWYLDRNPDLSTAALDPVLHYATIGGFEGRDPHPLFSSRWYLERYPDVQRAGINPLVHFIRVGAAEGRDPHPLFDASWYLDSNPDIAASGANPLVHFLLYGAAEGRQPNPLFDVMGYLSEHPELVETGGNPLVHYVSNNLSSASSPAGEEDEARVPV
jgi:hypothetical protein